MARRRRGALWIRPSASKHGDAPSFRAATRVVSDRTAPQHHSTTAPQHLSGGCGSRAMGSKPLATAQPSSFGVTRIEIQHGCRSLEPSADELVSGQSETPNLKTHTSSEKSQRDCITSCVACCPAERETL